ncbi:MAG: hypothetical protein ACK5YS_05185 [bacterium]|jgi:hypothetical protein
MESKLELPYKKHLAFSNEQRFKLSSTHNFESTYEQARNGQGFAKECLDSVDKIFSELFEQVTNERQQLFVEDLKKHSLRLLQEDLGVFQRCAAKPTVEAPALYENFKDQKFLQNSISEDGVRKINKAISGLVDGFRENAKAGRTKRTELSQNTGLVVRRVVYLLNKEFEKNGILQVMTRYMNKEMVVIGLAVELSVPNANWWKVDYQVYEQVPKTLYFHFDESIAYPKAIVYLTDVNERTGATSCSPNFVKNSDMSHLQFLIGRAITCVGKEDNPRLRSFYDHKYHQTFGCPLFRTDFSSLPDELRFSSHFGWDVIPGSELETFLLKDEQKIVGKAGTFIAFDGGLLPHRGGLILEGDRIALQVIFGEKISIYKRIQNKLKKYLN